MDLAYGIEKNAYEEIGKFLHDNKDSLINPALKCRPHREGRTYTLQKQNLGFWETIYTKWINDEFVLTIPYESW